MSTPPPTAPASTDASSLSVVDRRALRRAQWAVVLVLVALCLIRRHEAYWPLVAWPVYDSWRSGPLPSQAVTLEVRVVTRDGAAHRLRTADLVEWSRERIGRLPLAHATAADASALRTRSREYLARLVAAELGHDRFDTLEIWQLIQSADPLALPPIDPRVSPSEQKLATFDVAEPEVDR